MKKLLVVVVAIVVGAGGYVSGWIAGHQSADRKAVRLGEHISHLNDVGSYLTAANVSGSFIDGDPELAECFANMLTTLHFRSVRACLDQDNCRSIILEEVQKNAPELMDDSTRRFKLTDSCQSKPLSNPT
jgi:hypothetical protein